MGSWAVLNDKDNLKNTHFSPAAAAGGARSCWHRLIKTTTPAYQGRRAPSPEGCLCSLDSITLVQIGRTQRQRAHVCKSMVEFTLRVSCCKSGQIFCLNTQDYYFFHFKLIPFKYILCICAVSGCFCRMELCPQEGSKIGFKEDSF